MARQASENQQVRFFATGLIYTVHRVLDEWMEKSCALKSDIYNFNIETFIIQYTDKNYGIELELLFSDIPISWYIARFYGRLTSPMFSGAGSAKTNWLAWEQAQLGDGLFSSGVARTIRWTRFYAAFWNMNDRMMQWPVLLKPVELQVSKLTEAHRLPAHALLLKLALVLCLLHMVVQ